MTIRNPFANEQGVVVEPAHDSPLGGMDATFQDEISHPEAAEAIKQANSRPKGWYSSNPEDFPPTTFTQVSQDVDGERTGVPGPRNMGVVLARVTCTVKAETYTTVVRVELSPDARAKREWSDGAFTGFHPTKHDSATRMYSEAQGMYKAARGTYATSITSLLEFLSETPFRVNCLVKDDGGLTPWQLAPAGRRR